MYQDPYQKNQYEDSRNSAFSYAGFWQKCCAHTIDYSILGSVQLLEPLLPETKLGGFEPILLFSVSSIAYFTAFLVYKQSTPGGMLFGIKVADQAGGKIGLEQALIRSFLALLSLIFLGLGHVISAFTEKNQTLHDLLAKTIVQTEKSGSNYKYFVYSLLLSFISTVYLIFISMTAIGIGTVKALFTSSDGFGDSYKITSPKWNKSAKKVQKKHSNKNKIYKKLKLKRPNKMVPYLEKKQMQSNNAFFKDRDFQNKGIPLKLKGLLAYYAGSNIIEIITRNHKLYHILNYEVLDFKNTVLKEFSKDFQDGLIIKSFWLPKEDNNKLQYRLPKTKDSSVYKLRLRFPKEYVSIVFTKKDAIGSSYRLPNGVAIQLKKHFSFTIVAPNNEHDKIVFIPMNAAKKEISVGYSSSRFNRQSSINFSSNKEPIDSVAMYYIQSMDYLEESFKIPTLFLERNQCVEALNNAKKDLKASNETRKEIAITLKGKNYTGVAYKKKDRRYSRPPIQIAINDIDKPGCHITSLDAYATCLSALVALGVKKEKKHFYKPLKCD